LRMTPRDIGFSCLDNPVESAPGKLSDQLAKFTIVSQNRMGTIEKDAGVANSGGVFRQTPTRIVEHPKGCGSLFASGADDGIRARDLPIANQPGCESLEEPRVIKSYGKTLHPMRASRAKEALQNGNESSPPSYGYVGKLRSRFVYVSEDGLELTHCIKKGGQVPSWRLSPNNPRERYPHDHPGKARKR